jgi:hypothetical protein
MPPKIQDHVSSLAFAHALRSRALRSINEMNAVALEARSDNTKLSSLTTRIAKLDYFVTQFRTEHASVFQALVALDRLVELETVDDPIVTSMKTMCYEIELISSECAPNDKATTSSTITIAQTSVSLPRFDGSVLHWRSFRDIYVSLVHDNPTISDAERFHYLLLCL